jgi:hypothetical protein
MTISQIADRVYVKALKKKALTAGELAARAGFNSGRAISGALGLLVEEGNLQQIGIHSGSTRPRYVKVA